MNGKQNAKKVLSKKAQKQIKGGNGIYNGIYNRSPESGKGGLRVRYTVPGGSGATVD